MKHLIPALFIVIVGVVAIVALGEHTTNDVEPLVDDSLVRGNAWKSACPTVDGGAAASVCLNVDGGANMCDSYTDLIVGNDSTTCARVAVDGVTSSKGSRVGSGCRDNGSFPLHSRRGECLSEGPALVVDVSGGGP